MYKSHRQAFSVGTHNFKKLLEYAYIDVWKNFLKALFTENLYYVLYSDDYSTFVWVYFFIEVWDIYNFQ